MIRVHIWLPDSHNVGHASADISSDTASDYVSWWPGGEDILKARAGKGLTYVQDVSNEGRESDHQHQFDDLDAPAAARWWREFLAQDEPKYQLISTNCSWAVVSALKAAGSDARFPWYRLLEKYNLKCLALPNSDALLGYLVGVFKLVRSGNSWTFATARPLIDVADEFLPIWSPRDTHTYCKLLAAGIGGEDLKFPLIGI